MVPDTFFYSRGAREGVARGSARTGGGATCFPNRDAVAHTVGAVLSSRHSLNNPLIKWPSP
jgi:hypothetical protein